MSGAVLPAGAQDARYRHEVVVDAAALETVLGQVRWRRERLGMPLTRLLQTAGYVVEAPRNVLAATSVVARPAGDGQVRLVATVPRPAVVPEGELNPETAITVEYVGGVDDGWVEPFEMSTPIPPSLGIALSGSLYARYGYDLGAGVWLYRRVRDDEAPDLDGEAPTVEDDPLDWP